VMSDIPAGPDYFSRFLASNHDEDNAEIGEAPKSFAEVASEKFHKGRVEARRRTLVGKSKPVKVTYTLTIVETISPGNGDAARASEPEFDFDVKMSKAPKVKGTASWIDNEGNQVGKVEKQTTLAAVDGGRSLEAARADKARKKAV
jgi:hypothetical protein